MIKLFNQLTPKGRRISKEILIKVIESSKKCIKLTEELYLRPYKRRIEIIELFLKNKISTEEFKAKLEQINDRIGLINSK